MIPRRDVFQAIADPTRRQIISMLTKHPMNLNSIAENFDISRPAISQQIKILSECGLVRISQKGRERYCEAKLDSLQEVLSWVEQYRQYWEVKLDSLDQYLTDIQKK
jgi:DNA-binding transcriptional ArsR family regulator